jgi:hypothetical protein
MMLLTQSLVNLPICTVSFLRKILVYLVLRNLSAVLSTSGPETYAVTNPHTVGSVVVNHELFIIFGIRSM